MSITSGAFSALCYVLKETDETNLLQLLNSKLFERKQLDDGGSNSGFKPWDGEGEITIENSKKGNFLMLQIVRESLKVDYFTLRDLIKKILNNKFPDAESYSRKARAEAKEEALDALVPETSPRIKGYEVLIDLSNNHVYVETANHSNIENVLIGIVGDQLYSEESFLLTKQFASRNENSMPENLSYHGNVQLVNEETGEKSQFTNVDVYTSDEVKTALEREKKVKSISMVYGTENEEIGNVDFVVDSVVQDMFIKSMKMSKVKDIHQRITLYKEINDQYFCIFDDLKEAEEVENAEG